MAAAFSYLKDPAEIYRQSFATVDAEAGAVLSSLDPREATVARRLIHACGMVDVADDLRFGGDGVARGIAALAAGAPILADCRMVAAGIDPTRTGGSEIVCTLNKKGVPERAAAEETTRSAAQVALWRPTLEGAVIAIGNAPTALFRLMEEIEAGAPKPAVILGFPVGFVGAAESKDALAETDLPFVTLLGRRGGSAIAAAAVNALLRLSRDEPQ